MNDRRLANVALLYSNRRTADGIYSMELLSPEIASTARPGQFLMVALGEGANAFLRRPFSLAGIDKATGMVRLIYQVAGKGTELMATWGTGRQIDVLGPLGNGFPLGEGAGTAENVILVGGGMGLAPLLPLAKALREQSKTVNVFAGARSIDLLFELSAFKEYGCEVQIATEDGSAGVTGFATIPLERHLQKLQAFDLTAQTLYACGPMPFLKAVAGMCRPYGLEAYLSMEERMGCGIGACMGCSIRIRASEGIIQKRVCYDGPVFPALEVVFDG